MTVTLLFSRRSGSAAASPAPAWVRSLNTAPIIANVAPKVKGLRGLLVTTVTWRDSRPKAIGYTRCLAKQRHPASHLLPTPTAGSTEQVRRSLPEREHGTGAWRCPFF